MANVLEAQRAHEELLGVALARAKLDRHEAHWLIVAYRTQVNRLLGIASFAEYSERVLGHTPRVTEERLRVARALQDLPELAHALENGSLCWTAVRELTRVATPETERQWLAAARGRKVREIECMVSGFDSAGFLVYWRPSAGFKHPWQEKIVPATNLVDRIGDTELLTKDSSHARCPLLPR